jgi:hypothetical protein
MTMQECRKEHSRREFIRIATLAAGALAVPACLSRQSAPVPVLPIGPALPHLGGAPDTADGRTVAAFVDTVIPGRYRDPTGAPGGLDVNAPALFFDPELPALPLVPLLAFLLDQVSGQDFAGRAFADLTVPEREQALEHALQVAAPLELAVQLVKLAYYSSDGAADWLGYPGANAGYVNHPDFSFGRAMAREISADGNVP